MRWEDLREEEFAPAIKESHGVCAMAMGCLEMHGQHLPLGTDTLQGKRILELAAEREPVVTLPPLYFGDLQGAQKTDPTKGEGHYGYMALSVELLTRLLEEICDEVERNGFDKFVIVSSHGGNTALLNSFSRKIVSKKRKCKVFIHSVTLPHPSNILKLVEQNGRDYFPDLSDEDLKVLREYVDERKSGGHACLAETAWMYSQFPELTRLDKIEALSGLSTHTTDFLSRAGLVWGDAWGKDYPNAYSGHAPVGLTPAMADVFFELAVRRVAEALRVLKNEKLMKSLE